MSQTQRPPLTVLSNAPRPATEFPPAAEVDLERMVAQTRVLAEIVAGRRAHALFILVRSVERQARIVGLGTHAVQPLCPCGGRCPNGAHL